MLATFLLACLVALELDGIRLEDIWGRGPMTREIYQRFLFLTLTFTFGVAFGISLWATVNGDIGEKPSHYCPGYQYWWEDQCIPWWKWTALKTVSDPTAFFNFFLMLFTCGLLVSTVLLWRASKDQFDLAQQEFIASHRPKTIIRNVSNLLRADGTRSIAFSIANVGDTAIKKFHYNADYLMLEQPGKIYSAWQVNRQMGFELDGEIRPGGIFVGHVHEDLRLTDDELLKMSRGQKVLHIIGFVVHTDGNGVERRTGFFRYLDHQTGRFRKVDDDQYEYQD